MKKVKKKNDTNQKEVMNSLQRKFMVVYLLLAICILSLLVITIDIYKEPSQEELIADFYEQETAVLVSPHHLRKHMHEINEEFILVDLRSQEEYEKEHVIGAINIPAYASPEKSAYGDVERIVSSFKALDQDKDIIVYCYSMPCMTGRKIGNMLAKHGIYVKELGIGWNEWRYYWNLWNHEHEWEKTNVSDYVISGSEPGVPGANIALGECLPGAFGC